VTNADAIARLEVALRDTGLVYVQAEPGTFSVELPGEHRLKTLCWLTVGRHALAIEAFVMRKPDENREGVYAYLLARNATTYVVSWSIDDSGDVYLSGRLPLAAISADEIDRVLGAVLSNADDHFDPLLQLGFGGSIRREWAWRVKNGESLRNLDAFREFIAATPERPVQSAATPERPVQSAATPERPVQSAATEEPPAEDAAL
jgi:hypothetical protein